MQRLVIVLVTAIVGLYGQHAPPDRDRIVNQRYAFSVMRPRGWFVFEGGDLPSFYNFRAEESLPQGELPRGGAEIRMMAKSIAADQPQDSLNVWVTSLVTRERGINLGERTNSTSAKGLPPGVVTVEFDQPPLGQPGDFLHGVLVAWHGQRGFLCALLTFIKGDPKADDHRRSLVDLIRSFRSL